MKQFANGSSGSVLFILAIEYNKRFCLRDATLTAIHRFTVTGSPLKNGNRLEPVNG
jgi:hypothetical protein